MSRNSTTDALLPVPVTTPTPTSTPAPAPPIVIQVGTVNAMVISILSYLRIRENLTSFIRRWKAAGSIPTIIASIERSQRETLPCLAKIDEFGFTIEVVNRLKKLPENTATLLDALRAFEKEDADHEELHPHTYWIWPREGRKKSLERTLSVVTGIRNDFRMLDGARTAHNLQVLARVYGNGQGRANVDGDEGSREESGSEGV